MIRVKSVAVNICVAALTGRRAALLVELVDGSRETGDCRSSGPSFPDCHDGCSEKRSLKFTGIISSNLPVLLKESS